MLERKGKAMNRDLSKLKRIELLEIMKEQGVEIERLKADNEALKKQLNDKTLTVSNAGSVAEAALQLNGIFESAQQAADQYLFNIRERTEKLDQECDIRESESKEKAEALIASSKAEADSILSSSKAEAERILTNAKESSAALEREAKEKATAYWEEANAKLQQVIDLHASLTGMFNSNR